MSPMHALKADAGTALEELRSLRHRPVSGALQIERPTAFFDEDDRSASAIIALLADALEEIAESTTDAAAKEIAEDALVLFQGR